MRVFVVSASLCLFLIVSSSAQEPTPRDTASTFELKEILVTATRTSVPILEIPLAVDIVDSRDFASGRKSGLNDLLESVPGILVQSRAGAQDVRLTVRGFGARGNGDRSNAATLRGIKILIDGIPETEPDGRTALDLVDVASIDRIEVFRSNASTLFGNASGGVINLLTSRPFEQPFIESDNTFGSFGLRQNHLRMGVLLTSGQIDFSATDGSFAGWRRQSTNSSTSFRLSVMSSLGESTNFIAAASAANTRFDIPGPLTQSEFSNDASQANPVYALRRERRWNRVGKLSLRLSTRLSAHHTVDVLGFVNPKVLERSERNNYRDFNRYHVGGGLSSSWKMGDSTFVRRVTVGLDEAYQDGTILFYDLANGERGDSLRTNKQEGAETFGAFTQVELRLLDRLTGFLGLRYDLQHYDSRVFAAGARKNPTTDMIKFTHFTPRAAVLYRISQNHSVYLNVGGGLEIPAFNEVDPPPTLTVDLNPFLKPMTSTTYEIGAKGLFQESGAGLFRSFSYSLAAYAIDIRNEIVPWDGGAWFLSAGRSRRYGAEGGMNIDVEGGFSIRTAFTYLDARYKHYSNELGDFSKNVVPGIPSVFWSSRIRYHHETGGYLELQLEHLGGYFADDANVLSVPSSTVIDGSIGFRFSLSQVSFHTFFGIDNITNRQFAASAFINPSGSPTNASFLEPGLPRNFFGGLEFNMSL